jgi:hypothetical protein
MDQNDDAVRKDYPLGRGYGHDYMRGGEVFGGYGYSEREEYQLTRGERPDSSDTPDSPTDGDDRENPDPGPPRAP